MKHPLETTQIGDYVFCPGMGYVKYKRSDSYVYRWLLDGGIVIMKRNSPGWILEANNPVVEKLKDWIIERELLGSSE